MKRLFTLILILSVVFLATPQVARAGDDRGENNYRQEQDRRDREDRDRRDREERDRHEREDRENRNKVCFCLKDESNNPRTVCTRDIKEIAKYSRGVFRGNNSFGRCVRPSDDPPSVPEFGLLTGAMTFVTSGGLMYALRKRV